MPEPGNKIDNLNKNKADQFCNVLNSINNTIRTKKKGRSSFHTFVATAILKDIQEKDHFMDTC